MKKIYVAVYDKDNKREMLLGAYESIGLARESLVEELRKDVFVKWVWEDGQWSLCSEDRDFRPYISVCPLYRDSFAKKIKRFIKRFFK